jgi:hypothetical protein
MHGKSQCLGAGILKHKGILVDLLRKYIYIGNISIGVFELFVIKICSTICEKGPYRIGLKGLSHRTSLRRAKSCLVEQDLESLDPLVVLLF